MKDVFFFYNFISLQVVRYLDENEQSSFSFQTDDEY